MLTVREKEELLIEHNKWRRYVSVPDLRWSEELASIAHDWADKLSVRCQMYHSSNNLGENIFWANYPAKPKDVVDYWAKERFDYDYINNSCRAGKRCGHYTQMVWRETREVGCGRAKCRDGSYIWVCNYKPTGNIAGKRPY
ncbi:CAP domain-containing protein [Thermodesulfovibrio hydrogeniphilus]